MRKLLYYCLIGAFFYAGNMYAQQSDPDETPKFVKLMKSKTNIKEIKRAFEEYTKKEKAEGRLNKKNDQPYGWKQFKRWEYWWEPRTYPSGDFPAQGIEWTESQEFNEAYTSTLTSNWTELGPTTWTDISGHWNPGIGRINVIVADPNDPNIIYLGAPAGGLWKTPDAGSTWIPLTDNIPSMGVSAIAIHPGTNQILIGTGDRDANDTYGVGVLKSTDGGATWSQTPLTWEVSSGHTSARMVVNPQNPNIVFAGTTDGLYRSFDFGDSWTKVLDGDIDDLELKPGNPNFVYALVGKTFYRSSDGGSTFQSTSQSSTSRSQIAVTPAAPNNVYFYSKRGLYVSTDNGASFRRKGSAPTEGRQDWYDLAIAVSPVDANIIHVGEIETYMTTNGGRKWQQISNWYYPDASASQYVHSDCHELVYIGNTLFSGSDGLITKSNDGVNFTDLTSGLGIRQFYNIGISQTNPGKFGGGSQDNGTYVYTPDRGWHGWLGADGFEFILAPDNLIAYGTSQYGTFYKTTSGGTNRVSISQPGSGAWNTPFVMHPTNPDILYVGNSTGVRKTTDGMNSWTTIGNFNPSAITDLAIAESAPQYLYASVRERIWVSTNEGGSWIEISSGLPGKYITNIAIDPLNPERVVVTCSGYTEGEKVYLSTNAGNSWQNISYNLPNLPANASIFQKNAGLYVGMDVGIYYLAEGATVWEGFMTSLPNVPVTELEIQYASEKIRAGTYGRGVWESGLAESSSNGSTSNTISAITTGVNIEAFPNPTADILNLNITGADRDNIAIRVIDEKSGKTVLLNEIITQEGYNIHRLDVGNLPNGTYLIKMKGRTMDKAKRFAVKKQ